MAKQEFRLYDNSIPCKLKVYCGTRFSESASAVFQAQKPACVAAFTNCNEFVKRLVVGETLSVEAFRQEGPGYAFRSGRLRFYGAFSNKFAGCFVLSHVVFKGQQKLSAADKKAMENCLKEFDSLDNLP